MSGIYLFFLIFFCAHSSVNELHKFNTMYAGENIILDKKDIKKITVSNSRVIKVTKSGKTDIVLAAKRSGNASINIWYKNVEAPETYVFSVMSSAIHKKLSMLRTATKDIQSINISVAGEYIYITGNVDTLDDYKRIQDLSLSHKKVINHVKVSDKANNTRFNNIYNDLTDIGLTELYVRNVDGIMIIDGVARNKCVIDTALYYLNKKYPEGRFNINLIPYQVDIDVKIIELQSSKVSNFGLDIPGQYKINRSTVLSRIEIDSILNMEQSKGHAKIISNPSLVANDGEKAMFHVGGEIPIKLSSRYSSTLTWKNFGVLLNFVPDVINDNIVKLDISSEFSNIDESGNSEDVPGFTTRRIKTIITMNSSMSVVISGLISKSSITGNRGVPVLSDIPLINEIFSLNTDSVSKSELLVVVTPDIRFEAEDFVVDEKLDELLLETMHKEESKI